jgi:release factor glutamine methyltransferase
MSQHTNDERQDSRDETRDGATNAATDAANEGASNADDEGDAPTIALALREAVESLRASSVAGARREAATLLAATVNRDRAFLIAHSDDALAGDQLAQFRVRVRRRAAGEPLQYVTGHQEFYGLDFEVNAAVLIPRPETELLVETVLELLRDTDDTRGGRAPFFCDVGTGSGCVAVALLNERRDARAVAVDISRDALRVASRNAARHRVSERLALVASDCFAALDASSCRFDLVASNPPYVAVRDLAGLQREVREHEPRLALTPGGDGLSVIRRLITDAPRFLVPRGHLVFEIGFEQDEAVRQLLDPRVWTLLDIRRDLQGIPRTVVLELKN